MSQGVRHPVTLSHLHLRDPQDCKVVWEEETGKHACLLTGLTAAIRGETVYSKPLWLFLRLQPAYPHLLLYLSKISPSRPRQAFSAFCWAVSWHVSS